MVNSLFIGVKNFQGPTLKIDFPDIRKERILVGKHRGFIKSRFYKIKILYQGFIRSFRGQMEVNVAMLLLCRYVDYVGYCKKRPLTTQTTPPQVVVYLFHDLDWDLHFLFLLLQSPRYMGGSEKGTK